MVVKFSSLWTKYTDTEAVFVFYEILPAQCIYLRVITKSVVANYREPFLTGGRALHDKFSKSYQISKIILIRLLNFTMPKYLSKNSSQPPTASMNVKKCPLALTLRTRNSGAIASWSISTMLEEIPIQFLGQSTATRHKVLVYNLQNFYSQTRL